MPSSYTTNLKLTLPVSGELTGTWGDTVNTGITALLDSAIAGTASVAMTDANRTLTTVDGAADEARQMFIVLTGTLTAARNVVCPSLSKLYFVKNSTTGGFSITFKTSAGTGILVPSGLSVALYCDGTNVLDAITFANIPTINATTVDTTNLEVTNIKAKDGTAAIVLANTTGVATINSLALAGTVAGGGNQINNVVIGATTPLAGSFTTLSAVGDVTLLSAGTRLTGSTTTGNTGVQNNNGSAYLLNFGSAHATEPSNVWINSTGGSVKLKNAGNDIATINSTGLAVTGALSATGGINNTVIGATTPLAGSFTTATLTSGTVNGVPYLNGSKALTTGSALTYTGTGLGVGASAVFGGGTSTFGAMVSNASGTAGFRLQNTASYAGELRVDSGGFTIETRPNQPLIFGVNSTEVGRFTSTGLAVTGAFSTTGDVTVTSSSNANLKIQAANGATAGLRYNNAANTPHWNIFETFGGSGALGAQGPLGIYDEVAGVVRASFSSTGLAVTGALSATGVRAPSVSPLNVSVVGTGVIGDSVIGVFRPVNTLGGNTGGAGFGAVLEANASNQTAAAFYVDPGNGSLAEKMRLTSAGNLGIGTSSPAYKLDVTAAAGTVARFTGGTALSIYSDTGNTSGVVSGTNGMYFNASGNEISFVTNSSIKAVLNSAGNLGLGAVPSAWDTSVMRALQVGTGASFVGDTPGLAFRARILANAYYGSGGYKYIGSAPALLHTVNANNAAYEWFTAPSGTAGAAISFTQAMTLDASGNLMVGVTSASGNRMYVRTASTSGNAFYSDNTADTSFKVQFSSGLTSIGNDFNAPLAFLTNNTERARIDSAGNLGIGTSSPDQKLVVAGNARIVNNNALLLGFSGVEASLKYDSSGDLYITPRSGYNTVFTAGNLLVGTTALPSGTSTSGFGLSVEATRVQAQFRSTTTAGTFIQAFYNPNGLVGSIQTSGSATSFVTSSDYRLKNTVVPMTGALDKVALLKPVTYKWNADGSDGQGFIAHELAEVEPGCVSGEKDETETRTVETSPAIPAVLDEDGVETSPAVAAVTEEQVFPKYQGIDTSFLVATLTAAIQEQQVLIKELTARLEALEAK
jgi:hypothetical protein